ncbi:histidinol-phosphate transaminase [Mesonia ostreae]|uniref:Histidinol-phosphate aminotransferase n=1 Tax=Mesonia ostreae TaxID=861110 RepID=A0ABU2KK23_9FLAO|nr:histidinol-phosphate transaminase [Mesonia ostreae]MDT0295014.1 histidinol-phosphate transaminase [Mesonia ostreae]
MKKEFNLQNLVRSNVRKLQAYSSARDEFKANKTGITFLDANENPFENGLNRYPDPQQRELKSALAKLKNVKPTQILLGNGSDEVLDLLFRAFCEPKENNIITLPPSYGMYRVLAEINAIENREVLLDEDFEPNFRAILEQQDNNTKLLFICSPNNPTGNSFDARNIKNLLENFNGLVVIDEAYIDFSSYESWVNFLDIYPNLAVVQTMSKAYGMAGIRLGVAYASAEIITVLNKIKPPYNINEVTQQHALKRVLDIDKVMVEVESILKQREQLIPELSSIGYFEKVYPSDANFVLVKVDNALQRYQELIQKGIVVRNRTHEPLCENTLRFSVGTPKENQKLVQVLKEMDS